MICRDVIPFQGFVGSAQTGMQFGVRSNSTGTGAGSRSPDINSTGSSSTNSTGVDAGPNPSRRVDIHIQGPSSFGNMSDRTSTARLTVSDRTTSPESPNPASLSTSLSPSVPAALSTSPDGLTSDLATLPPPPAGSPASHAAKPTLASNATNPAVPLLGKDSKPHTPYSPSTSAPAVHALSPSGSTASPNQAASPQSAAEDQSNISPSNTSNTMRSSPEQNPRQSNSSWVATFSPQQGNQIDRASLAPAPAAVKATSPGLPPAAFSSQLGTAGQMGAAPGQSPAAPQQMPADSAQAKGPDSAALLPLPGPAPAAAPASSRAAATPGDAQAVHEHEKTHTDTLPVIVLGVLLGVAIAGLLAGELLLDCVLFCLAVLLSHVELCSF